MFTGVTLPFSVAELLTAAMELVELLGPFVLLGLALLLGPRIITVIKGVMRNGRTSN